MEGSWRRRRIRITKKRSRRRRRRTRWRRRWKICKSMIAGSGDAGREERPWRRRRMRKMMS